MADDNAQAPSCASSGSMELPVDVLRRLQLTELDILRAVRSACEDNGITYFIDSGTFLGAVRHGGFIPWDDDVDVGMPRADYDRFCELAPDILPEGYSLHTFENTPGFAGMFAKVYKDGTVFETAETREAGCTQGIFVDILPYDALPADVRARRRMIRRTDFWQKVSYLYHAGAISVPLSGPAGVLARAACRVAHGVVRLVFSREGTRRRYRAALAAAERDSDVWCALPCSWFGRFPEQVLFPTSCIVFEGETFACPHDARAYLEIGYGPTWTELPPPEDRHTHAPLRLEFGDEGQAEMNSTR